MERFLRDLAIAIMASLIAAWFIHMLATDNQKPPAEEKELHTGGVFRSYHNFRGCARAVGC